MGTEQITCQHVLEGCSEYDEPVLCGEIATKRIQTSMGRPLGGPTPIHYPGRGTK